jgi:peptidoglycan/LPS O-acetylase OafA/YrhL
MIFLVQNLHIRKEVIILNSRIEQLDSIRGIAAFCVFVSHIYAIQHVFPAFLVGLTPLKALVDGHAAVILFFVLSGFVLSIPFLKGKDFAFASYLTKRVFRIYVPYLVAILFAMYLSVLLSTGGIEALSSWFNLSWTTPPTPKLILEHVLLLGNIHSNAFNGVIWSLIHEMRISLIFPFVVLLIKRWNWKVSIILCILLSFIGELNHIYQFQKPNGNLTTYFDTTRYLAIFTFGGLLAKHKDDLIDIYQRLRATSRYLLVFSSLMFYNFSDVALLKLLRLTYDNPHFYTYHEYGIVIGASGFIVLALGSLRISKLLLLRPFLFLGRISYSLYLYHVTVLLSLIYLFHDTISMRLIFIASIPVGMLVSTIAWHFVENPSMKIGRILAPKLNTKFEISRLNKSSIFK